LLSTPFSNLQIGKSLSLCFHLFTWFLDLRFVNYLDSFVSVSSSVILLCLCVWLHTKHGHRHVDTSNILRNNTIQLNYSVGHVFNIGPHLI
jgi:hypothetical protein